MHEGFCGWKTGRRKPLGRLRGRWKMNIKIGLKKWNLRPWIGDICNRIRIAGGLWSTGQ
jgi:hypothetical protein